MIGTAFINRKIGLAIGMYLISFLICILITSSFLWIIGLHLTSIVFFLSLMLAMPVFKLSGVKSREVVISLLYSFCIIIFSTLVEMFIYDVSYDGNAYHQPIIFALANGWNPIYEHHNPIVADSWNMNIWIDHYCKGAETIAAAFYSVTGNIESGKALNLILPVSLSLLLFFFFREHFFERLSKVKSILYSVGISFSMITIGQITSYYIDHIGYFTFVLALVGAYEIVDKKEKFGYWCMLCSIVLAAVVKFNMLFWIGFIVACDSVVLLLQKRKKDAVRLASISATMALISAVIFAFNPFVTNYIDHRNPVYPLYDKHTSAGNSPARNAQPPYIYNAPRYKQVILSYSQRPSNDFKTNSYVPPYKITKTNVYRSGFCATCVGGGGLLFIEILLTTFIIFIHFRKGKHYKFFIIASLILVSTLFVLPVGSVFRYVPFIYLLPFFAMLYLETIEERTKTNRIAQYILAVLLFCNIAVCAGVTIGTNAIMQYVTMRSVKTLECTKEDTFHTMNWGFCNKLYHGDMIGREPVAPMFPEDRYEREIYIGGPFVYIIKP